MNILITGGAGFVGSHLAEHPAKLGHSILVIDNFSTGRRGPTNARTTIHSFTRASGGLDVQAVTPMSKGWPGFQAKRKEPPQTE